MIQQEQKRNTRFILKYKKDKNMRDYKKDPLKHNEPIPKEEMYELYINQNYSRTMLQEYFNVGRTKVYQYLKKYGFEKSVEQRVKAFETTSLEKYGTTHPRKDKIKNNEVREKTKQTCLQKYGVESCSMVQEVKQKARNTRIKRFGVDGIQALDTIKEKREKNCLEKYGVKSVAQTTKWKEKHKQTNLEKYGKESYFETTEFKNKSKETCLQKYGVEYATQSDIHKEKTRQTNLEKYGVECSLQNKDVQEKSKQTLLEKYGVDNYSKAEDFVEKTKKTCQEKYGVDFASQSPEFRQRVANTNLERYGAVCNLTTLDGVKKKKETWLKNLGVDHPSKSSEVVKKQWETRKKNGTTSSSKGEQYIKQKLEEKFYIVEHNYKQDPRYPFYCDFYIPDLDLFIEYQGFEGHGNHPFNSQCKEDLLILEHWIEKAEQRKLDKRNKYLGYIETWTQKDPLKRQTAKQNNLNWIEFFTLKEFDNWYKNSGEIIINKFIL